jgi:hypothetical protein
LNKNDHPLGSLRVDDAAFRGNLLSREAHARRAEFDVHVVKVEGSGGDEGTSQSSHVTEIIRRVEQRMKN